MFSAVVFLFLLGYFFIAFESLARINKAAVSLLTGVACWTAFTLSSADTESVLHHLSGHISDIAGILFFLVGAMTIVELIDAHDGFEIITRAVASDNKRRLLWVISLFTFFLSAVLDNLTTTIVMVSLLRKLIADRNERLLFAGTVVIAANAGGAWSPIGDVTTTMLWIGGQVTTKNIIAGLFLPSLACLLVPLAIVTRSLKGNMESPLSQLKNDRAAATPVERNIVFFSGIAILLLVPVFKSFTHLPPYMGMLLGLGLLWLISELVHKDKDESDKNVYSVLYALRKIDMPSILFFLGILLAVSSLESAGHLGQLAAVLDEKLKSVDLIVLTIGFLSAIIDNVPLVAAAMGMYDLSSYPADHYFWEFLAYCSGTGGSILVIGSAAGVAAMGMEKIDFIWYLKRISWLALAGYLAGAGIYILMQR